MNLFQSPQILQTDVSTSPLMEGGCAGKHPTITALLGNSTSTCLPEMHHYVLSQDWVMLTLSLNGDCQKDTAWQEKRVYDLERVTCQTSV